MTEAEFAIATVRGDKGVTLQPDAHDGWFVINDPSGSYGPGAWVGPDAVANVRPMRLVPADAIVLDRTAWEEEFDPADVRKYAVELLDAGHPFAASVVSSVASQLEPPAPPKPEEPQEVGATVRDVEGRRWVRVECLPDELRHPWARAGALASWSELDVPAGGVLYDGLPEDGQP